MQYPLMDSKLFMKAALQIRKQKQTIGLRLSLAEDTDCSFAARPWVGSQEAFSALAAKR